MEMRYKMKSILIPEGKYHIKIINKKNGKEEEFVVKNRIMNAALNELIKAYSTGTNNIELEFLAVGDDDTAVNDTDTTLGNEIFRTEIITKEITGTGELQSIAIIYDDEAVGTIKEIGIFGGSSATITKDSCTLVSRILWNRTKTSSEEIQFTRTDTIGRG
jgi:hypothetical protein